MPRRNPPTFLMVFQEEYERISLKYPLGRNEQLVLNLCMTRCEYGGEVPLTHAEMARIIGIAASEVSRVMKKLAGCGYVLREPSDKGNQWRYRLPTTIFHRGPLEELPWRRHKDMVAISGQRNSVKRDNS